MLRVGDALRRANVAAVYLVHGTFVGHDPLGALSGLRCALPGAAEILNGWHRSATDKILGERGNYTQKYAQLFEQAINGPDRPRVAVKLFCWSSENNHVGRADGAVRLVRELLGANLPEGQRLLLWGHSHGGNVFALVTNLLAGSRDDRQAFFEAARPYYRSTLFRRVDVPYWEELRERLCGGGECRPPVLDLVTFGTPVRYGWDTAGYARLMHFVHHRCVPGCAEHCAKFPPAVADFFSAKDGDYIQQIGIAGSNTPPGILTWRTYRADVRLCRFLQPGVRLRDFAARLAFGMRVPEEGLTYLVDYGQPTGNIAEHHAGHALYTDSRWLLFHAEAVAEEFYGGEQD